MRYCVFCQSELTNYYGVFYECQRCPTVVSYTVEDEENYRWYYFIHHYQDQRYQLIFAPSNSRLLISEVFSIVPSKGPRICTLSFLPNITPTNVQDKLPLYLTFS
jgi:hypothetical protein